MAGGMAAQDGDPVVMKINGKELEPWDPFCLSEMRDDDTGTIRVAGPVNKDCDVILENGETEKAAFLIKEILSQGDVRSKEMYAMLSREGISHRTAEDTKKEIGIHCYRKMRHWYWSLQTGEGEIG